MRVQEIWEYESNNYKNEISNRRRGQMNFTHIFLPKREATTKRKQQQNRVESYDATRVLSSKKMSKNAHQATICPLDVLLRRSDINSSRETAKTTLTKRSLHGNLCFSSLLRNAKTLFGHLPVSTRESIELLKTCAPISTLDGVRELFKAHVLASLERYENRSEFARR
jgi:hypothetical protein